MSLLQKLFDHILSIEDKNSNPSLSLDIKDDKTLSGVLKTDVEELKNIFSGSTDVIVSDFKINSTYNATVFFLDGFINKELINSDLLRPLMNANSHMSPSGKLHSNDILNLVKNSVTIANLITINKISEIINSILSGNTILLVDGISEAFIMDIRQQEKRAIEESKTEPSVRGPRDGFAEDLQTNLILLRKRLKSPRLTIERLQIGTLSQTAIALTYINGIVDEALVKEVKSRISRINIDAILDSSYIEEMIEDNRFSIFPQLGPTERPDRLASYLLEGHVGIIVDNSPIALIAPCTFFQLMKSSDDYYQRFIPSSMIRFIRYLFLLLALTLPSFYIAVLTYHQGMIPKDLLYTIWESREGVPFPVFIEAVLMEVFFEALREAGLKLPNISGQTVSIVGALVIGEAAVRAGIVSSSMVIIVSITGIASFMIPKYSLGLSIRVLRFVMMILSATLGLYGMFLGIFFILIHMAKLRSFGVPYLAPAAPIETNSLKDIIFRAPWWSMINRPNYMPGKNHKRMNYPRPKK